MSTTPSAATPSSEPLTRHQALAHPSRLRLLELLGARPDGAEATELAEETGLHPNTVRLHLDKLVAAGLATSATVRSGGRGRPPTRYRATTPDAPAGDYRLLATMLTTALATGQDGPAPAAERAGHQWGRALADRTPASATPVSASDEIAGLFDRLGFAPEPAGDHLVLHACPYRELAREHPDVVCGLHLGLLRGALSAHDVPADSAWLTPFVTPTRCHAGLRAMEATD